MTRKEFLAGLREALEGEVSEIIIAENLNYYNGYIRDAVAKGTSEQEVLRMLGDPRLIAQTIIDTNGGEGDYSTDTIAYEEEQYQPSWQPEEEEKGEDSGRNFWFHISGSVKWYHKILAVLVPILFILVIVAIAIGFLQLVAFLAVPLLIVFVCIYLYRRFIS